MVALLTAQLAFLSPERLLILLVIPVIVLGYIFATRRKNRRGMRFTNTSMLDVVVPKQSQWRRHVAVALSLLSLITLTAAYARPKTQIDVPRERATVVLVIDASLSMQATDVHPTRLDAAKQAAIQFVNELPETFFDVPVLWVHGHTHQSFDYRVRSCRIVCNPRGYVSWSGRTENQTFDPGLTLQLPDCKDGPLK